MSDPLEPFDDALERMQNAHRAAHDAFRDADAALTVSLQAMREATAARGTIAQQLAEMRETIQRLETLVMEQTRQIRELRNNGSHQ